MNPLGIFIYWIEWINWIKYISQSLLWIIVYIESQFYSKPYNKSSNKYFPTKLNRDLGIDLILILTLTVQNSIIFNWDNLSSILLINSLKALSLIIYKTGLDFC